MSIRIETSTCIGCGRCTDVCPGNLLFLKDKRAAIRDVRDCWGCTACVKECPKNAIFFTLEAELGGAGVHAVHKGLLGPGDGLRQGHRGIVGRAHDGALHQRLHRLPLPHVQ